MKNTLDLHVTKEMWIEMSAHERWQYVGYLILRFAKKNYMMIIFLIAAIVSCFFIPQEEQTLSHYVKAINPKTIVCLFILMLTIRALTNIKFFKIISAAILKKIHTLRALELILVFLPALCSLFITHDVALITFIPFTIVMMDMAGMQKKLPKVIILEVLACSLAGTISPIGTLQNIYLLDELSIPAFAYITTCWPIALAGYGAILIFCLIEKKVEISPVDTGKRVLPKGKTILYLALFILSVVAIFDFIQTPRLYWIIGPIVAISILITDRRAYAKVKYPVLILFLSMFVIGANLQCIPVVNNFLEKLMSWEFFVIIGTSQVVSNTTAIVLLAPFTSNIPTFLIASAVSKFGSPITTTANQMVMTIYPNNETKRHFLLWYILAEFGFLFWLMGIGALMIFL